MIAFIDLDLLFEAIAAVVHKPPPTPTLKEIHAFHHARRECIVITEPRDVSAMINNTQPVGPLTLLPSSCFVVLPYYQPTLKTMRRTCKARLTSSSSLAKTSSSSSSDSCGVTPSRVGRPKRKRLGEEQKDQGGPLTLTTTIPSSMSSSSSTLMAEVGHHQQRQVEKKEEATVDVVRTTMEMDVPVGRGGGGVHHGGKDTFGTRDTMDSGSSADTTKLEDAESTTTTTTWTIASLTLVPYTPEPYVSTTIKSPLWRFLPSIVDKEQRQG